jgi:hypothetical protein
MFGSTLRDIPEHSAMSQTPPAVDRNPETEALFAAELSLLSMRERDEVLHDIHGVADSQHEDPALVKKCCEDLEDTLALIPVVDKGSYQQARDLDESYVTNDDFLLMFLRACSFNVKLAAARMISFFNAKKDLFGLEKLAKEITYDDLDEEDIRCLESGYVQILSGRDRAGRAIFFLMPMIRKYSTLQNRVSFTNYLHFPLWFCYSSSSISSTDRMFAFQLRSAFIVMMHCLRDDETQRNGMVGVAYNVGSSYTAGKLTNFMSLAELSSVILITNVLRRSGSGLEDGKIGW